MFLLSAATPQSQVQHPPKKGRKTPKREATPQKKPQQATKRRQTLKKEGQTLKRFAKKINTPQTKAQPFVIFILPSCLLPASLHCAYVPFNCSGAEHPQKGAATPKKGWTTAPRAKPSPHWGGPQPPPKGHPRPPTTARRGHTTTRSGEGEAGTAPPETAEKTERKINPTPAQHLCPPPPNITFPRGNPKYLQIKQNTIQLQAPERAEPPGRSAGWR